MFADKAEIERALTALGERLALGDQEPADLVVCGGSALNILGLIAKTTQDIDVLALVVHEGGGFKLVEAGSLPGALQEAAQRVSHDLNLAQDWINANLAHIFRYGLPDGILSRAESKTYGPLLTIRFLGRYDQIHLKLLAAIDAGGRHFQDLVRLKPSEKEVEDAARWIMRIDIPEAFKIHMKHVVDSLGYPHVAQRL